MLPATAIRTRNNMHGLETVLNSSKQFLYCRHSPEMHVFNNPSHPFAKKQKELLQEQIEQRKNKGTGLRWHVLCWPPWAPNINYGHKLLYMRCCHCHHHSKKEGVQYMIKHRITESTILHARYVNTQGNRRVKEKTRREMLLPYSPLTLRASEVSRHRNGQTHELSEPVSHIF